MRISVDESDPGYSANVSDCEVELNGKCLPLNSIVTADEELGEIWFYPMNGQGDFFQHPDEAGNEIFPLALLRGKVRIVQTGDANGN